MSAKGKLFSVSAELQFGLPWRPLPGNIPLHCQHAEGATMYCPECGVEGRGKFCVECGTRLRVSSQGESGEPHAIDAGTEPTGDWTQELRYEQLIRYAFVRDQITMAGQRRPNRISGEQLLKIYDTVASPGVPLEKLSVALLPILDGMGLKTGSQAEHWMLASPGRALLATLCALASGGYDIENVDQLSNGCVITAFLPSTLLTNRGKLVVTVVKPDEVVNREESSHDADETRVLMQIQAAARISGQIVDWGKGKRILAALLEEVRNHPELRAKTLPRLGGEAPRPNLLPTESAGGNSGFASPPGMPEPKSIDQINAPPKAVPPPIRRDVA